MYALAAVMTIAWAILEAAFCASDFTFNVVAQHSSTTTPAFYKLAAPWSSQEGSLLLWVWLLSLWSSLVLFLTRKRVREIAPYATAVLLGFAAFFTSLAAFFANPFSTTATPPTRGRRPRPAAAAPEHDDPPADAVLGVHAADDPVRVRDRRPDHRQARQRVDPVTRRFALAAWLFLGIGVVLGARWSYTELGWGGYWAWDPVENAALMPWLATHRVHPLGR